MIGASEFLLEDVRCFRGEQRARLRPITLLVGENSTGKTTFLGCYRVLHSLLSWTFSAVDRFDFNKEPFSMGSFRDIVRLQRGPRGRLDRFSLGLAIPSRGEEGTPAHRVRVTFSETDSQPTVSSVHYEFDAHAFTLRRGEEPWETVFETPHFTAKVDIELDEDWIFWLDYLHRGKASSSQDPTNPEKIMAYLNDVMSTYKNVGAKPDYIDLLTEDFRDLIPIAPLRSKPKRTYDPVRETASPEGEHVPMLMMRLDHKSKHGWGKLHGDLLSFGAESGLFSDIAVRRHGQQMSDPFQLQVKVRTSARVNIMDVGYGVSQSLPILVDVQNHEESTFLLQQPEVHLHPRAQAELASLFVASYKQRGNHFMIETHSDYIIDRVRILAKNGKIDPDDVSILYFAPQRNAVKIHNISLNANGDLENVPDGYRDFFIRESDRLLGFDD